MLIIKRIILIQLIPFCLDLASARVYLHPRYDLNILQSVEDDNDYILMVLPNNHLRAKSSKRNHSSLSIPVDTASKSSLDGEDLSISDLNLNNQQKDILRKRWTSSCDKKAARICSKACKTTYKVVCDSYKCSRGMKRKFRKECRRNCKSKFVSSTYYSDY